MNEFTVLIIVCAISTIINGVVIYHLLRLVRKNDKLEKLIRNLQKSVNYYKDRELLYEAQLNTSPFPYWLKDPNNYTMIFCNRKFEDYFLKPIGKTAAEYLGKTDDEIWSKEDANIFRMHDERVKRFDAPVFTKETVNNEEVYVAKYPIKVGNVMLAIAGQAFVIKGSDKDLRI